MEHKPRITGAKAHKKRHGSHAVEGGAPPDPPPAARRALAEAEERRRASISSSQTAASREIGGRGGLDPVRYGDWEVNGITSDF